MADRSSTNHASTPAWDQQHLADPHAAADKAHRVRRMFAAIADSYDLNNRLHSLWRDQAWRRAAVRLCAPTPDNLVLDVACGTGDLAIAFARAGAQRVLGVDFTHNMLPIASRKARTSQSPQTRRTPIHFAEGDAMRLPLPDNSVDVVSIAFGIRNVSNPALAIAEFARVLRPAGRLCILEFSLPTNPLLRAMYNLYFHHIMPRTAAWISRDRTGAYRYLPQSVNTFLDRDQMQHLMHQTGFQTIRAKPLTFGIAVVYVGTMPD